MARPAVSTIIMRWFMTSIFLAASLPLTAQTSPRVQVELKCRKSPCAFQIGEVIPIDLSFSSSDPKRYQLNMASYDRSGRMSYEKFNVTPQESTRDPLQTYFAFGEFMMGGLTTFKSLTREPVTIKLILNEWVSFERPGTYRVKVSSSRVTDTTADSNERSVSPQVTSNEIEIEIVPADKGWQERELKRIVQELDNPKRTSRGSGSPSEPLIALRHLGTEGAARELARRFGTADANADIQCMFGLLGSPNSAAGLAEMRALLRDPNFPVNSTFLRAMSYLPLVGGDAPDVLQKQQLVNMENDRAALIASLPSKRGTALGISTETALEALPKNAPEAQRRSLSQQLVRDFESLSPNRQITWLKYRWDDIKDPSWIPVIKKIATAYQNFPELREMSAYQSLETSGTALRRWYELDPEGARSAVVAEIVRPRPRYGSEVLGMLKDASLPDVEWTLVENLAKTTNYEIEGNILTLLERYGTGITIPDLISKRGELVGKWACAPQNSFLGYILKFDAEAARPLIEGAIAARGDGSNACRHSVFTDLGSKHRSSILEELAVSSLNDPDPQVATGAATYLGRYGSAAAEQPLWTRYLAWSRAWTGRERELRVGFGASVNANVWEANLGQALARALAQGVGWFCDEAKLQRILDLAIGEYVRSTVDSALRLSLGRLITFTNGSWDQSGWFALAQYDQLTLEQLRAKLKQFPSGTAFHWTAVEPTGSAEQDKAFRELADAVETAGMKLLRE